MNDFPDHLVTGYGDFRRGRFAKEAASYRQLAESGQKPTTMVIACCDSRAAPELVFSARPGELFVVRNVANLVPPYEPDGHYHGTSAALEFAVQALRVRHIVVMGHGRCGGVAAVLDDSAKPLSPGDFIGRWMELLRPAASRIAADKALSPAERQTALEQFAVRCSLDNLRTFPCVSILEGRGQLRLHGAWFDIAEGRLSIMDAHTGNFTPLMVA